MLGIIVGLVVLIGTIAFYQILAQAAQATIVMSCRMDHGHFANHWMPCNCKCHQMPASERPSMQ
jgi:hypothetical protein